MAQNEIVERSLAFENAQAVMDCSSTLIGVVAVDGVVLVAHHVHGPPALDTDNYHPRIVYEFNKDILCGITGCVSEAQVALGKLRRFGEKFLSYYQQYVPCKLLVETAAAQMKILMDHARPMWISMIFASWNESAGYQLYHTDPAGEYQSWKIVCLGKNSSRVSTIIGKYLKDSIGKYTVEEALSVTVNAINVLEALHHSKLQIAVLKAEEQVVHFDFFSHADVKKLFIKAGLRFKTSTVLNKEQQELFDKWQQLDF